MKQFVTIRYLDGTKETYASEDIEFYTAETLDRVKPDGRKYINQASIEWAREADKYEIGEFLKTRKLWRR